ncbi:MAG: insulinase family protein [Chloroflexales bacterium]|nr:insulinase family protein [Chloroflexales bacterium]
MRAGFTTTDGLHILVEELPHTHSVSVGCFVAVGTRHESGPLSGVSHLIEHMCFKGTRRFPTARLLSLAIEEFGGLVNASTSYESTVYWAKVANIHFDRALESLVEMLRYPLFDPHELEKERRVIIEEIRGTQDSPSDWVHELIHTSIWGDQPLGRDIAGTIETVNSISRADLLMFWQQHYTLANMVISIAGNIDMEQIVKAVSTAFAGVNPGSKQPALPTSSPQLGPNLVLAPRETEQGNFCLGVPALSYNDPDRRALQVLDTIVGGGMSSRLFQELREERGLAYNVGSYVSEIADTGMWVIYGGVETEMLCESVGAVLATLRSIVRDGVTEEEVAHVKGQVKGGILLSLEDTWSVASRNGSHQLRYSEVVPVERVVAEVEAVTCADVLRVARRVLRPEVLHLSVVGPYNSHDEQKLRALLDSGAEWLKQAK